MKEWVIGHIDCRGWEVMEKVMEGIMTGCYWGFLAAATVQDFCRKQIDLWLFVLAGVLAAVGNGYFYLAAKGEVSLESLAAGAGIGILLMGAAAVSRGGIGLGDGCFFCISGLMLGFWKNLTLFCISMMMCGVCGLFLMAQARFSGHKQGSLRKKTVPFMPFVLAAAICMEIGGRG